MMQLTFKTAGAAFADDLSGEVARVLRLAADRIENGAANGQLYDSNGNRVGAYYLDLPEEEA